MTREESHRNHVRGTLAKLSGVDDPGAYVTLAAKRAIADQGVVTLPSDLA